MTKRANPDPLVKVSARIPKSMKIKLERRGNFSKELRKILNKNIKVR